MSQKDRTLVVGVDYSDHCIHAVDEALLATALGGTARVVPVLVLPGGTVTGRLKEAQEMTNEVIQRSRENLARLVEARAQALGLLAPRIEPSVRFGAPAEQLLAEARERDAALVAVGTHGRTGLAHLFMGSVAEEVMRHASCSVLVARSRGEARAAASPAAEDPALADEQVAFAVSSLADEEPSLPPEGDPEAAVVTEPHIDAGRVVLHVLDGASGQVFACAFEDETTVVVEPLERGWVPFASSDARARAVRAALAAAAREPALFSELFQEIERRRAQGPASTPRR